MLEAIMNMILPETNDMIYRIAKTRYAKRAINSLLIVLLTMIFRSIIYSFISFMIIIDSGYIDFFVQCGISTFLCLNNGYVHKVIHRYDDNLYKVTRYAVNNWSEENYRKWRNYFTFALLFLGFIYFSFVEINSNIIRVYILQYALCHVCIDISENKNHIIRQKLSFRKKEKFYITDKNVPNTDYIMIDKRKILRNISSEFDMVRDNPNNSPKNEGGFEILE